MHTKHHCNTFNEECKKKCYFPYAMCDLRRYLKDSTLLLFSTCSRSTFHTICFQHFLLCCWLFQIRFVGELQLSRTVHRTRRSGSYCGATIPDKSHVRQREKHISLQANAPASPNSILVLNQISTIQCTQKTTLS